MLALADLQLIGDTIALRWNDGREDFFTSAQLRKISPSAETRGETDLFGRKIGGDSRTDFSGVTVTGWEMVGRYAVRFLFSDGHNTGLYSFTYLREEADKLASGEEG
jgi:DUF971 family protein